MNERERLGSRLGFIMLSAGCAIGCGNVWKFPWMTGQNGGGGFVLIYAVCLLLLGFPVLTMEFAMGRASQASPVRMYQKLEKPGQKWHIHGYLALLGNVALMSFYTVVTGWMIYYFLRFLTGQSVGLGFGQMISDPAINVIFMLIAVAIGFGVLCFNLQGGLERVTKYLMLALLAIMFVLAIHSLMMPGAKEGIEFYLIPDFSKVNGSVIVGAMNQAFFTLSVGIGSMSILGSYIGKERTLPGESVNVILLDTVVAIVAGLIIFPACYTYGIEVTAGPSLLFDTMATVFNDMAGGRLWGSLFFLFMTFAAFSTELAVFENILACVRELTGWKRPKGCLFCGVVIALLSMTTALGYSVLHFQPFAEGTAWLDLWDFIVSTNLLPVGSFIIAVFCCYKSGWGWDAFVSEANSGKGLKLQSWMKPIFRYFVPACVLALYIYGLVTFAWH
ncbi:MAG TPA: sodium-dependent transporter [Lachnospiraceae bacterium]|nr:sodium-dependent transporter [Lachnospiraceae bacterium]HBB58974.1 sodium-dependent transporter [Lachnospiraceae bacterium]